MNAPEQIIAVSDVEITEKRRKNLSDFLSGSKNAKHGAVPQSVGILRDLTVSVRERFGIFQDVGTHHRQGRNKVTARFENAGDFGEVGSELITRFHIVA